MFLVSKLLGLMAQPLVWVAALLALALLLARYKPRAAKALQIAALTLLLAMGWLPLPDMGVRWLESQYAEIPPTASLSQYAGLVVLGGGLAAGQVAQDHAQPSLNDSSERMSASVAAVRRAGHLQLVFTGGEGALLGTGPREAARAQLFFESQGVPPERVRYEAASRNTYDNAVMTAQLSGIDIHRPWLLVTSAWHMPRAMATFKKAGWNVTAYPVDFRTGNTTQWSDYELLAGSDRWQLLLHELVGLISYRLAGRS